jgi:hypothetical protein
VVCNLHARRERLRRAGHLDGPLEIVDTEDTRYRPVPLDTAGNPFAYTARPLEPGDVQPSPASAVGQGPIQGELLLFRIPISTLQNRPLQLRFRDPTSSQVGVVDLDV